MPTITIETYIDVPPEICFDLARDIGLHCRTAARTKERAVSGVTTGLIGLGEEVTFEAVHFGIRQRLTSRIVQFDRPNCFEDEMLRGAFQSMRHIHTFRVQNTGTLMTDVLHWTAPCGLLGRLADYLFLEAHMRSFLMDRNAGMKRIAESEYPQT